MEQDSPSKPSVAELAGRFKDHSLSKPTSNEVPFRRRPPSSLKLSHHKDENEESNKTISPPHMKVKTKNSALIQKLQANLALSPTALLPSPKSPDVKLQPAPLSPSSPQNPLTPLTPQSPGLRPPLQSSEEKEPVSFQKAPEGSTLPSFNKTRARLSFKRRPPTRQHRRSTGEEGDSPLSTSPNHNSLTEQTFNTPNEDTLVSSPTQEEAPVSSPTQEEAPVSSAAQEDTLVSSPTLEEAPVSSCTQKDAEEARDSTDCDIREEVMRNNPEDTASGLEEQPGAAEQGQEDFKEEQQQPSEPCPAECDDTEAKSKDMEAAQDTNVNCEE